MLQTEQAKQNVQNSQLANCCQLTMDEVGLFRLKLAILAILCVILGTFLMAFKVQYFFIVETCADLKEQYATAASQNKALKANMSETVRMLADQKNKNDNLTKEITNLKTELQGVRRCADKWEYYDGSFYYFSSDKKNWTDSRDACVTMGGHLVIIKSTAERDFLKNKRQQYWIGLSQPQPGDSWYWVDNTPLTGPKFWHPNQPDNHNNKEDCGMVWWSGQWNDDLCSVTLKRICETKSCIG
ncbi:C-type lectin domain family 6 member A-like isoform X2 [Sardina pilchardus]|uniref:C-type lectin domain family 6 member A-like isoform X2 n=1 Tax=Sardina pilchardus TaxID=27697 RepID=UPI002E0E7716